MASFDIAVKQLLAQEGGLVNNPADSGGITKYGISKAAYPALDIASLTQEQAIAIYQRDYWEFDGVADQRLANLLLSMCVNNGKRFAIAALQKVCGIPQDGIWGSLTQRVVNNTPGVLSLYGSHMIMRYVGLAIHQQSTPFLAGWVSRVTQCLANQ